ncbi:cystathionine gamma-synthase [Colletotrichum tofieldiae]|nr:cystathionine gamma-synthase [Colletotrichum tofieldiae]GKT76875.1 cystathionine gamma-synthase [Colletotrichum tofieldiae]
MNTIGHGFLQRTAILNRNAAAAKSPSTPITGVPNPPLLPDYGVYNFRKPAPDLSEPRAVCLLGIDLESVATARAFYDRLAFYPGLRLGAHRTLSFVHNLTAFGKDPDEATWHPLG